MPVSTPNLSVIIHTPLYKTPTLNVSPVRGLASIICHLKKKSNLATKLVQC